MEKALRNLAFYAILQLLLSLLTRLCFRYWADKKHARNLQYQGFKNTKGVELCR